MSQGRIQEFVERGGGLHFISFQGGSALVEAYKPPEINRFHWSRGGGLSPHSPPEYASEKSGIFDPQGYP